MEVNKAIFNLQRFEILKTKLNPNTSHLIADPYAYAWHTRMYPVFGSGELHEDLEDFFSIKKQQVEIIVNWSDKEMLDKRYHTFYEYEKHFSSRHGSTQSIERHALIAIFRYSFLDNRFDDLFWKTLLAPMQHPSEASLITSDFKSNNISLT